MAKSEERTTTHTSVDFGIQSKSSESMRHSSDVVLNIPELAVQAPVDAPNAYEAASEDDDDDIENAESDVLSEGSDSEDTENHEDLHSYRGADIHCVADAERIMGDDLPPEIRTLNDQQRFALDEMLSGANVFLTGEAGTGKSYVTRAFINLCDLMHKKILVTGTTGIAAINIHGATLHRTFGIPLHPILNPRYKGNATKVVKSADIVLIDEISMCRADIFDYVACQLFGLESNDPRHKHRQLIVVGDFFQLPPVVKMEDADTLRQTLRFERTSKFFAFESQYWADFNFHCVSLKKIMRQDDPYFISLLNKARIGDASCVKAFNDACYHKSENLEALTVVGTNKLVDEINALKFEAIDAPRSCYEAVYTGDFNQNDCLAEKLLELKPGARVMAIANDVRTNLYQNGSLGSVSVCADDYVLVNFDNGKSARIGTFTWSKEAYTVVDGFDENNNPVQDVRLEVIGTCTQIPLRLAYAITIHKSQGQTFDNINLQPNTFDVGQLYVALSRVRTLSGLVLLTPISSRGLLCSPEVMAFYRDVVDMNNEIHAETAESLVNNLGSFVLGLSPSDMDRLPPKVRYKIEAVRDRLAHTEGGTAYSISAADYTAQAMPDAQIPAPVLVPHSGLPQASSDGLPI